MDPMYGVSVQQCWVILKKVMVKSEPGIISTKEIIIEPHSSAQVIKQEVLDDETLEQVPTITVTTEPPQFRDTISHNDDASNTDDEVIIESPATKQNSTKGKVDKKKKIKNNTQDKLDKKNRGCKKINKEENQKSNLKCKIIVDSFLSGSNGSLVSIVYKDIVLKKEGNQEGECSVYNVNKEELDKFKRKMEECEMYCCEDCDYTTQFYVMFKVHFMSHANLKFIKDCSNSCSSLLSCYLCDFKCKNKSDLDQHIIKKHTNKLLLHTDKLQTIHYGSEEHVDNDNDFQDDVESISTLEDDINIGEKNLQIVKNIEIANGQNITNVQNNDRIISNESTESPALTENVTCMGNNIVISDSIKNIKGPVKKKRRKRSRLGKTIFPRKPKEVVRRYYLLSKLKKKSKENKAENNNDGITNFVEGKVELIPNNKADVISTEEVTINKTQDENINCKRSSRRKHHPQYTQGIFECVECNFVTKFSDQFEEHVCKRFYSCQVCRRVYTTQRTFDQHVKIHPYIGLNGKYQCRICNLVRGTRPVMSRHIHSHHCTMENRICEQINCIKGLAQFYTCHVCLKKFDEKKMIIDHIERYHPTGKVYKCSFCKEEFMTGFNMRRHRLKHICRICKFQSNNYKETYKHMMESGHIEQFKSGKKKRMLFCKLCNYKITSQKYLEVHMLQHTDPKPFACTQCDFRSNQKGNLLIHEKTHIVSLGYSCTLCDYRTNTITSFQKHKNDHGLDDSVILSREAQQRDPRFLYCDRCEFKTKFPQFHKSHCRKHDTIRPYLCSTCGAKYSCPVQLCIHRKKHATNEKIHKCSSCDYSHNIKACVKQHERTMHSNAKPFQCEICSFCFKYEATLKSHLKKHRSPSNLLKP